jgi:hypothetical protein
MTRTLGPALLRDIFPLRQIIKPTSVGVSARGTFQNGGLANEVNGLSVLCLRWKS